MRQGSGGGTLSFPCLFSFSRYKEGGESGKQVWPAPWVDSQVVSRCGWSAARGRLRLCRSVHRKGWGGLAHQIPRKDTGRPTGWSRTMSWSLEGWEGVVLSTVFCLLLRLFPGKPSRPPSPGHRYRVVHEAPTNHRRDVVPPCLSYWEPTQCLFWRI